MKNSIRTFLTISIIYLTLIFILSSCSVEGLFLNEPIEDFVEEPVKSDIEIIDDIIKHFNDISTHLHNNWENTGENLYQRNSRWKDGGLNGTDRIDVFFKPSFNNDDAKNELISFMGVLDNIILDENIKFNVVNNIDDADIVIMFGDIANDNIWGYASIENEYRYDIPNADVTKIVFGEIKVDRYDDMLLKHEFLHVLGFHHTTNLGIMNHYVSNQEDLSDTDIKVIQLLYHNGDYGVESVPKYIDDPNVNFPFNVVRTDEWNEHINNLIFILENRYDLYYN